MGKSPGLRLQAAIVQDNVPVEVAPQLFVGSIHAAFNVDALKELKITHILNLAGNYATFPEEFAYLSVGIRDKDYANLLSCLPVAMIFVDAGIQQGGGVLIHCAGGRSRSPAVAISYLMIKHRESFDEALASVRALRPVVSLNLGFETQLRCLDEARGDVFAAHQLMLRRRLVALAQKREEGLLDLELQKKQRRHERHSPHSHSHTHRPRSTSDHSSNSSTYKPQLQPQRFCDERGMLHGRVPSGFCLSLPSATSKESHFIPALRCMGTLIGCKACGENLLSTGSIVTHEDHLRNAVKAEAKLLKPRLGAESSDRHSSSSRLPEGDISADSARASNAKVADDDAAPPKTKRPLLAKLRLRPSSGGGTKHEPDKVEPPGTPRLAVLKNIKKEKENEAGAKRYQYGCDEKNVKTRDEKGHDGGGGGFWRSLTSFKVSSKRLHIPRDSAVEKSTTATASQTLADDKPQKQKPMALSPKTIELAASDEQDDNRQFLRENAQQWERKVRLVEHCCTGNWTRTADSAACTAQVSALVAQDEQRMCMLDCEAWFVEPQPWLVAAAAANIKGDIACPNEKCSAVLGMWNWGGLACSCGGSVTHPAFRLHKDALRVLGNLTIQPEQLLGDEPRLELRSCSGPDFSGSC